MNAGKLYIVATPIGNYRDISLRALDVLKKADVVVCEEYRQGSTMLKKIGVGKKELLLLNEHTSAETIPSIMASLLEGKCFALVSDCGTPVFADPGADLLREAYAYQIPVIPVPGPSSLMGVISLSPIPMDTFYFCGFLPRKKEIRKDRLAALKRYRDPIILMDTPYRLARLLEEVMQVFGKNRTILLAVDMTLPGEKIFFDQAGIVYDQVKNRKSEFMLIVYPFQR